MSDLISRSALKEATKSFTDCDGFNPVWQIIDNAPTVTDRTEEVLSLQNTIAKLVEGIAENERPQGKWIKDGDIPIECCKCSNCNAYAEWLDGGSQFLSNYCPKCGAEMDKEADNV